MSKLKDTQFTKGVSGWLKKEFPVYGYRFRVIEELQIYDANSHESLWKEKQLPYKRAEVFIELARGSTEYVCDLRSDWPEIKAKQAIMIGLSNIKRELESFVNNKIST